MQDEVTAKEKSSEMWRLAVSWQQLFGGTYDMLARHMTDTWVVLDIT
jgi:hypothetical protein